MNIFKSLTLTALAGGIILAACTATTSAEAAPAKAKFTSEGAVKMPTKWREWIYVGTPLTPNALNGGEAPFPEFHNVYIEPKAYKHFAKTGEFAEGTQIVKELVSVRENDNDPETGASSEVSGQGYMMGEFIGLELTIKDNKRYKDHPGGWAYFSFGHQPEPYNATAEAFPAEACNACHNANAENDWVFTQFYPVLRAVDGK